MPLLKSWIFNDGAPSYNPRILFFLSFISSSYFLNLIFEPTVLAIHGGGGCYWLDDLVLTLEQGPV
jgi:hypothetical protein